MVDVVLLALLAVVQIGKAIPLGLGLGKACPHRFLHQLLHVAGSTRANKQVRLGHGCVTAWAAAESRLCIGRVKVAGVGQCGVHAAQALLTMFVSTWPCRDGVSPVAPGALGKPSLVSPPVPKLNASCTPRQGQQDTIR